MSCVVLCAFESPAATAHRAHSSPHEIFQVPTATRDAPAPSRAATPEAAGDAPDLNPGDPTKHHTRDAAKVKAKRGEMRKKLTTAVGNYEKSGQDDPDEGARDFTGGDLALEYCWRTLEAMKTLTDFGTKRLLGEAAAEDGSPPPDDDVGDVGSDEDTGADPTPAAAPAPKRRRSAQRPATHKPPPLLRVLATEDDAFSAAMKTFVFQGIQLQQQALSKIAAQPEPNAASSDAGLQLAFAALRENLDDESRRLISEEIAARVTAALERDTPIQVN